MVKYMRRRKSKKMNRTIIIIMACLLFGLTAGYGALNTNLNMQTIGIIKGTTPDILKKKVVTSGDGLYIDQGTSGRYVYRGKNPNNYVKFNNELWRIVSIEKDNVLKIVRNESLGNIAYDVVGNRDSSSGGAGGTYCQTATSGCNAWASVVGNTNNAGIIGTVTKDSSLNTYLNTTYYNTFTATTKKQIQNYNFNVGAVGGSSASSPVPFYLLQSNEQRAYWNGNLGLLNVSDYLQASSSSDCMALYYGWAGGVPCATSNYLNKGLEMWLLNSEEASSKSNWMVWGSNYSGGGGLCADGGNSCNPSSSKKAVYPVTHLKATTSFSGSGTSNNPYMIN